MGIIDPRGEPLKKAPTERLVDELFAEIDRYHPAGKRVVRDEADAAAAPGWLAENEDATAMTPERLAAMEAAAADEEPAGLDQSFPPCRPPFHEGQASACGGCLPIPPPPRSRDRARPVASSAARRAGDEVDRGGVAPRLMPDGHRVEITPPTAKRARTSEDSKPQPILLGRERRQLPIFVAPHGG